MGNSASTVKKAILALGRTCLLARTSTAGGVQKNHAVKVSIRHNSRFDNSNLTLEKIILLTYFWVYKCQVDFVKHELDICDHTIVDWYNFSREVCICILDSFLRR